jgi:hypothetical protein
MPYRSQHNIAIPIPTLSRHPLRPRPHFIFHLRVVSCPMPILDRKDLMGRVCLSVRMSRLYCSTCKTMSKGNREILPERKFAAPSDIILYIEYF